MNKKISFFLLVIVTAFVSMTFTGCGNELYSVVMNFYTPTYGAQKYIDYTFSLKLKKEANMTSVIVHYQFKDKNHAVVFRGRDEINIDKASLSADKSNYIVVSGNGRKSIELSIEPSTMEITKADVQSTNDAGYVYGITGGLAGAGLIAAMVVIFVKAKKEENNEAA